MYYWYVQTKHDIMTIVMNYFTYVYQDKFISLSTRMIGKELKCCIKDQQ